MTSLLRFIVIYNICDLASVEITFHFQDFCPPCWAKSKHDAFIVFCVFIVAFLIGSAKLSFVLSDKINASFQSCWRLLLPYNFQSNFRCTHEQVFCSCCSQKHNVVCKSNKWRSSNWIVKHYYIGYSKGRSQHWSLWDTSIQFPLFFLFLLFLG